MVREIGFKALPPPMYEITEVVVVVMVLKTVLYQNASLWRRYLRVQRLAFLQLALSAVQP